MYVRVCAVSIWYLHLSFCLPALQKLLQATESQQERHSTPLTHRVRPASQCCCYIFLQLMNMKSAFCIMIVGSSLSLPCRKLRFMYKKGSKSSREKETVKKKKGFEFSLLTGADVREKSEQEFK